MSAGVIAAAPVAAAAAGYSGTVLADSPRIYWRLGEASGNAADASGNGKVGTLNAAPTQGTAGLLTADTDTAYTFTGAANQRVTVAETIDPTSFSVDAWVNQGTSTGGRIIAARHDGGLATSVFVFRLNVGKLEIRVERGAGAVSDILTAPAALTAGRHHVAATVTPSSTRLYVDGAEVASLASSAAALNTVDTPFTVGGYSTGGNQFIGVIDEVAYYDTALSEARVVAHYVAGSGLTAVQAVFTASGTFTPPAWVTSVDVLLVGGGGAGGASSNACGGGGGAGGVRWVTGVAVTPGTGVTVTVGAGGVASSGAADGQGADGASSAFGALTALGGGGGGAGGLASSNFKVGRAGGSGGGGGTGGTGGSGTAGGAGTAGQGNNGGAGATAATLPGRAGGGGGGAGGTGSDYNVAPNRQGGVGVNMSANVGTSVGAAGWFGGGGGGGVYTGSNPQASGGQGGGGSGGNGPNTATVQGTAGLANTGGGGGGSGSGAAVPPRSGGSGVVIVVYTA